MQTFLANLQAHPAYPTRRQCQTAHRWLFLISLVLFAVLVAFAFHGCANGQTAGRKAFVSVDAATDVINGVADAYDAKLLTKAQVIALVPYCDAVKAAQVRLNSAIAAKSVDVEALAQALTDAVSTLLTEEAKAKRASAPASQPL